jgi:hypothetical protein
MIAEEVNVEPHEGELRGYHTVKISLAAWWVPSPSPFCLFLRLNGCVMT